MLDYIDDTLCGANTDSLPFAGTASATATRSFETPLVDGPGQCGVIVVSIPCYVFFGLNEKPAIHKQAAF